jgi:hypothetical protein
MMFRNLLLLSLCSVAFADGGLRMRDVEDLAQDAHIQTSSGAGTVGGTHAIDSANDGTIQTWWASAPFPQYPVSIELRFGKGVTIDTLAFVQAIDPAYYTNWKTVRIEFSDGSGADEIFDNSADPRIIRFDGRTVEWVRIQIIEPYDKDMRYITLREIMACHDPERKVEVKAPASEKWRGADVAPRGRERHPCVYMTGEDVARARERLKTEKWAQDWFEGVLEEAEEWAARDDQWIAAHIPEPGACFAYGFTGCPICGASWPWWGRGSCSFDNPGHVTCANGHVLPDQEHPDPGTGYVAPDGRVHYFVGSYNAWLVETLQFKALQNLALAYSLTDQERYAEKAAFIMDLLADIYPTCDKGAWDSSSHPLSGRFCRPGYAASRVLVRYVDWYDQIFNSPSLDKPSVREGMSRRQNIELNLLQNGAAYCYTQSLPGGLDNGMADYVRGALSVGSCLGIPWYVHWAYDGPYGILSLVRNNIDRDGRYFETSTGYADHTRGLYLTFAEPLLNYRSEEYPEGINLYDDDQFQSFCVLPQLSAYCAGKTPRFGDWWPDVERSFPPAHPTSDFDYRLIERLYARASSPEDKEKFGSLLLYLTGGDVNEARASHAEIRWMLFHAAPAPDSSAGDVPPRLMRRISHSEFFGHKGLVILRSGEGRAAQAALIRYGPSLNHGHLDDLNLNYYALGYEVTYDLGMRNGSTHTQQGWAKQTTSHNLVLVDETCQQSDGSDSGGSLHQFADLPGLKLTEVSSENSYAQQAVTTYRRLLALVGEDDEQYLVDIFRVVGGKQHDYLLHALSDQTTFAGVKLGEPEQGSLAGPQFKWGAVQLNDGNMPGFPDKPYWNPPPGNGFGFLMEPQRGKTDDTWHATWELPSGDAFLRLTMLGQPGTEIISAWAPGLFPTKPKARYAIARRRIPEGALASTYVGVLEPYGINEDGADRSDAKPFIKKVERLVCHDQNGPVQPAGVVVVLNEGEGVRDTIVSAGDSKHERTFRGRDENLRLQGRFAHIRYRDLPTEIHLVGTRRLVVGDLEVTCAEPEHAGTVRAVDEMGAVVETEQKLPTDGRLNGQLVVFDSERYSRSTAHRIARIEALEDGSRIHLESPSLILGTGILEDDPINNQQFTSLLPHGYARNSGWGKSNTGTQFFSGKLIKGEGFATNIVRTDFGQLMGYIVDSTATMSAGDRFVICDLQPGDSFLIPTMAYLARQPDGAFTGTATTEVVVRRGDKVLATVRPTGQPHPQPAD